MVCVGIRGLTWDPRFDCGEDAGVRSEVGEAGWPHSQVMEVILNQILLFSTLLFVL